MPMKTKSYVLTLVLIIISISFSKAQTAYIPCTTDSTVFVIDINTHSVIDSIRVGKDPRGVTASADGSKVYIANSLSNTVTVINTATNTVSATIHAGNDPYGIVVTPDGSKVYVANLPDNKVKVINTATNTVIDSIVVGTSPDGAAVSPDGSTVYISNSGSNTVSVISTSTNTVTHTINVGHAPRGIAFTPNGAKAYVANCNDANVSIINTATFLATGTITVGTYPCSGVVSPDGSTLYVSNITSNSISVINTSTDAVTTTVPIGSGPSGISITEDGTKVYVANSTAASASELTTASNTVTNTVALGGTAVALGNFISGVHRITTNTLLTSICAGAGISVPYNLAGTFTSGNVFTAQLSNASGSFASPVNIGTLSATSSGTIPATIPSNTTAGSGYRIRVVSSTPSVTGSDNGSNITVNPTYTTNVSASVCQGNTYTFPDNTTSTTATTHTSHFSTIHTCDSSIVTTLSINPTYSNTVSASICQGNTYTFPDNTTSTTATTHTSHFSTINTCDSSIVTTLTVNPLPNVSVSPFGFLCDNWYPYAILNEGSPSGGIYSGTGVSNDTIYCFGMNDGTYTITYTFTDVNSCSNTASDTVVLGLCEGVNQLNKNNEITIAPNPFTAQTTITFSEEQKNTVLKITDILGNTIQQTLINDKQSAIDLSGAGKGIYFVEIINEKRHLVNKKIVVQ